MTFRRIFPAAAAALALFAAAGGSPPCAQTLPTGSGAASPSVAVPLVARDLGRTTIPVDGPWQFHPGDNLAWASPTWDDTTWKPLQAGKPWEGQGFRNLTGFAWYRRRIAIGSQSNSAPEDLLSPPAGDAFDLVDAWSGSAPAAAPPPDWQLALLLPAIEDAADVYWNGRLIGSYGRVPPHPVWYLDAMQRAFVLGRPQSGVLAIRVWKAPYVYLSSVDEGGLTGVPRIGSQEAVASLVTAAGDAWLRSSLYGMGLALLCGVVALLAWLAWLRDRRQWVLFWLALYTLHPLALLPVTGVPGATGLPGLLDFRWGYGLVAPIISIEDVSLWFLLLYLLGLHGNRRLLQWTRVLALLCVLLNALDGALQLFNWTTWPGHRFLQLDIGFTIPALLLEAFPLVLVAIALRQRLDAARWLLAIAAVLADLIQAVGNWSGLGARWTHWTLDQKLSVPLFSLAGSQFAPLTLANSLLLIAIVYAVWRFESEQRLRQSRLDEEFHNAQELQQVLIPHALPEIPGYSLTSAYKPALHVGGDFFQIMPLQPRRFSFAAEPAAASLVVIGDVSGKGLRAAMTVSFIVGAVRTLAETISEPAEILAGLNRRLHGRVENGFATCIALRIDEDGHCVAANAGHLPPYLNGEELTLPPALPLGMVPDAKFETRSFRAEPGDRLVVYTDGLLEARNTAGELFGFDRVRALMGRRPEAQQAVDVAVQFGQEDDVTVLVITRTSLADDTNVLRDAVRQGMNAMRIADELRSKVAKA
ncbi:MAG TPA: PP2C family protein-serine/threonine phosphatase [Acidobacteriaceae bacterium]|nr:PP2C family protein-serine/threonine phosphatase [Acidobacteriaceae bacterium]